VVLVDNSQQELTVSSMMNITTKGSWSKLTSAREKVPEKADPFYLCNIFVRFHPNLLIFGRNT